MKPEEIKAKYPEASQAIFDEGQATGKEKGAADIQAAEKSERERILGLAEVQFGAEQGKSFADIVATGVTVEQFKAVRGATPQPDAQADAKGSGMEKMLAAIEGAGAPNPGAGGGKPGGTKDFEALVAEHQAVHKCSKVAAMQAAMKQNPAAHATWLENKQTH